MPRHTVNRPAPAHGLVARLHQLGAQQANARLSQAILAGRHTGDTVCVRGKFGATTHVGSAQPFTFSRTMRTQDGQLLSVVSTRAAAKMAAEADTPLSQTTIVTEQDSTGRVVSRRLKVDSFSPRRQPRPSLAARLMVVHRQPEEVTPASTRRSSKYKPTEVVRTCSTPSGCATPRTSRRSVIARDIVRLPNTVYQNATLTDVARTSAQRERFASFQSTPRAMRTAPDTLTGVPRGLARTKHTTLKAPCVITMASPLPRSSAPKRGVSAASRPKPESTCEEAAVDFYVR